MYGLNRRNLGLFSFFFLVRAYCQIEKNGRFCIGSFRICTPEKIRKIITTTKMWKLNQCRFYTSEVS